MGLDQFAIKTKLKPSNEVDFGEEVYNEGVEREEIQYWRKHPDLHGWMENLYFEKGGDRVFNCTPVILTLQDLDNLEEAIRDRALPKTSGFFFGESDDKRAADDLEFIKDAREAINEGYTVFYDSWW